MYFIFIKLIFCIGVSPAHLVMINVRKA